MLLKGTLLQNTVLVEGPAKKEQWKTHNNKF